MYRWRRTCAAAEPPSWLSCFHRLHKHMPGWTIQPFVSPMAFSFFEKAFDWLPVVNLSSIISSFIKSEDGSSYVHLLLPHCVLCMKDEYSNVLSWECLPKCASSSSSKADDPHRHQTKFSHASFFFDLTANGILGIYKWKRAAVVMPHELSQLILPGQVSALRRESWEWRSWGCGQHRWQKERPTPK